MECEESCACMNRFVSSVKEDYLFYFFFKIFCAENGHFYGTARKSVCNLLRHSALSVIFAYGNEKAENGVF